MKQLRYLLIICLSLCAAGILCARPDGDSIMVFRHGGVERQYKFFVPDSLADWAPLVMVLHGYGGKPSPDRFGMREAARRHGFAVCWPKGYVDGKGKSCWNVGYPFQEGLLTDDVDFVCTLASFLVGEYGLNADNVFCCGHSNGGEMCYLMAYRKPEFFAAFAPLAGLTLTWMAKELESKSPVSLLEIHGTADKTSLWDGDPENLGGWGAYLSVPDAVGYWVEKAGCRYENVEFLPVKDGGRNVLLHRYGGSPSGHEVWLCEIEGGPHSLPDTDLDTGDLVLSFFSRHLR